MKISEVIEVLQAKLKKHGDVTVSVPTDQEVTGEPEGEVVSITSWMDENGVADRVMMLDSWTADQLGDDQLEGLPANEVIQDAT